MGAAMPDWVRAGFGEWSGGCAALAQARSSPLAATSAGTLPTYDRVAGFAFTAAGRLDNRDALMIELDVRRQLRPHSELDDAALMLAAYRRWGEKAPARLLGDWSLAAWHPAQRRLFLARDQLGHAAIYYFIDDRTAAFSCSQRGLLALDLTPIELDELYLAQYLIAWPRYQGERTPGSAARRLPPAHTLAVTPDRVQQACYWQFDPQSERRLASRADYAGAMRETFDEAVRVRLRSKGAVGSMLSGGLDSGSVAATAAEMLRHDGRRLMAFTSVPIAAPVPDDMRRFGDELGLARATAAAAGNIDISTVRASRVSPIEGIRRALELFGAPIHAAGNMYWLLELYALAERSGCDVLLNGGLGNPGISWAGDPLSQPLALQLRQLGMGRWLRRRARNALPRGAAVALARRRFDRDGYRSSAIDPGFARRLRLGERELEDPDTLARTPRDVRLAWLRPGSSTRGETMSALSARFGLDPRDPTADIRVLAFALSVPDAVFRDPQDGAGRWLIRESMRGRLPDEVRLNRRRGLQAADLVARLRNSAKEVDEVLIELERGPAADYLDTSHIRRTWEMIQRENTRRSYSAAVSILTRGIMGGLYANGVSRGEPFGPEPEVGPRSTVASGSAQA
jgi:asparagine synthase (glutamine-hydrolysing)